MDLLLLIGIVIGAAHAGWVFRELWAKYQLNQFKQSEEELREQLNDDLEKIEGHFKKNFVNLKLEKIYDTVYVYDMKDESFVCQGKSKTEILELFSKKYPDKKGLIHEGHEIWKQM